MNVQSSKTKTVDPVCGMEVDPETAAAETFGHLAPLSAPPPTPEARSAETELPEQHAPPPRPRTALHTRRAPARTKPPRPRARRGPPRRMEGPSDLPQRLANPRGDLVPRHQPRFTALERREPPRDLLTPPGPELVPCVLEAIVEGIDQRRPLLVGQGQGALENVPRRAHCHHCRAPAPVAPAAMAGPPPPI